MDQAIAIMNNRVNSSGVVEPDIQRNGSSNIVISVANVDEEQILALVGQDRRAALPAGEGVAARRRARSHRAAHRTTDRTADRTTDRQPRPDDDLRSVRHA